MTTANEEFGELMPHRIKVTAKTGKKYDDNGRPIHTTTSRTYMCLIDDTTETVRNAQGTEVTTSLTAYVAPVPLGSTDGAPIDILEDEKIEMLSPYTGEKEIHSIERHFDADNGVGMLHNLVVRFQ